MSVFKRPGSEVYSYDFRLGNVRYHGSTETTDYDEAVGFEALLKDQNRPTSAFCRRIIRRSRRGIPATFNAKDGYVYMIRSGHFVKIGYARDPKERIKTIMTSVPGDCDLLFCLPGSLAFERRLHQEFAVCHHTREWFFFCGPLKKFIEEYEGAEVGQKIETRHTVPRETPLLAFEASVN